MARPREREFQPDSRPIDPFEHLFDNDPPGGGGEHEEGSDFGQRVADASYAMNVGPAGDRAAYAADQTGADYVAGPYDLDAWSQVDKTDREDPELVQRWNECQLCIHSQSPDEREAWEELDHILQFPEKNEHEMSPVAMACAMREMYERDIRGFLEGSPAMRTRMFWIHIDEHAPSIRHMTETSVRTFNNVLHVIREDQLYEHAKNGKRRVNAASARLMLSIEKERKAYIKTLTEMRGTRG